MAFVPEGQHDSSQARSAWNHKENSPVPAGRLNRSQLNRTSSDPNFSTGIPGVSEGARAFDALSLAHAGAQFRRQISVGLTIDFDRPSGTEASLHRYSSTSCLATITCPSGTNQPVPPGQTIRPSKRHTIILALMGLQPELTHKSKKRQLRKPLPFGKKRSA
jgi:hypothetical protein